MAYDMSDDDLPPRVCHGLKALGWRWDASAQGWRKPLGYWDGDVAQVVADIEAEDANTH